MSHQVRLSAGWALSEISKLGAEIRQSVQAIVDVLSKWVGGFCFGFT